MKLTINNPRLNLRLDSNPGRLPPPIPEPPRILHGAHPPRFAVRIRD